MNRSISAKTASDIDGRVERVLRGLGHPEPPLQLKEVRELLRLDLAFYTANDPGVIREAISRIRVAGIQIYKRPMLLAIQKSSLSALYLPDRKRILLDAALPQPKHRNEAHEIGHSVIPWHEDVMLGDNARTLSPDCREQVEAEANFAAGRLLFLRDRFTDEVRSVEPSAIQRLRKIFGNTLSTTLYRFVESAGTNLPLVGMITGHPHASRRSDDFDPSDPCRHLIRSPAFAHCFGRTSGSDLFSAHLLRCTERRSTGRR